VVAVGWGARVAVISVGSSVRSREAGSLLVRGRPWGRGCDLQITKSGQCSSSEQDRIGMAGFSSEDADRVAFNGADVQVEVKDKCKLTPWQVRIGGARAAQAP
jgi:hypothetical protein